MKYSFYSTVTIDQQLVGSNTPLGDLPITFINAGSGGNIPTLFSLIEDSETVVENVITGVDSISSSSDTVSASLISGQKLTVVLIRAAGNWGTVTLNPSTLPFITIVSTVTNILTLQIDTNIVGVSGDYLSDDYNKEDYLTSGINQYVGCYDIEVLNDAAAEVALTVCIYPASQIRKICVADALNFAWINNREGGFNSYALECKYIKGRNHGRQSTYLTADKVLRKSQIDDVYDGYEVASNSLSKIELDLLQALISSVQCFLYNTATLAWDIPIILDVNSFKTYGNRFNQAQNKIAFSFRLAEQVEIQTQ